MKKITTKHLKHFITLLRHEAAFDQGNKSICFTYPRGGWVTAPVIDGKTLEFVGAHDDGELPLNKIIDYSNIKEWKFCPVDKIIFGYISGF